MPKSGLTPKNLSAQISYEAKGNPISSRPVTSVANCCPGLEVDFRAVWRRMFRGIELREHDNLVVNVDKDCDARRPDARRQQAEAERARRTSPVARGVPAGRRRTNCSMMTPIWGPASSDPEGKIRLTTSSNPDGLAPLEWSNALARVLRHKGARRSLRFQRRARREQQLAWSMMQAEELCQFQLRGAAVL